MGWRALTLRAIARSVLGAVLLAQVALAAQACVMPAFRPAAAFSGASAMSHCEQNQAPVDLICLAQCLQAYQAIDWPHDLVAAPPATFSSNWLQLAAMAPPGLLSDSAPLPTGPPVYLSSHRLRL